MVKHYEQVPRREVTSLTCDRCGTHHEDVMDRQEYLSWHDTCGYGNTTYGDMSFIQIDLCQHCVKEVLGPWIKVSKTGWSNPDELAELLSVQDANAPDD